MLNLISGSATAGKIAPTGTAMILVPVSMPREPDYSSKTRPAHRNLQRSFGWSKKWSRTNRTGGAGPVSPHWL